MACPSSSKLLLLRRLSGALKLSPLPPPFYASNLVLPLRFRTASYCFLPSLVRLLPGSPSSAASRSFCSLPSIESQGPSAIDYRSLLQEDDFHRLADSTIQDLQEKLEEYGDSIQIEGFDIDYENQVLTLKLGDLGTYVLNKQTPNRQIWLSSPLSGPSRFDWDRDLHAWLYRRNKVRLLQLLEEEMEQLCRQPISLS